jgi:hypothetical protein
VAAGGDFIQIDQPVRGNVSGAKNRATEGSPPGSPYSASPYSPAFPSGTSASATASLQGGGLHRAVGEGGEEPATPVARVAHGPAYRVSGT